jgi:hypothetical protein
VYVDLQQDSGVLKFGSYKTSFSVHALIHVFQVVCRASLSFRDQESHTHLGLSTRLVAPLAAAEWFFKQRNIVMVMVFIPVFVLGLVVYGLELVLDNKVLIVAAFATWLFLRSKGKGLIVRPKSL